MQCARAILSSVACPALQYFSVYLIIGIFSGKNVIKLKMCALTFSTILSQTLLILRRTERATIRNVYRFSCRVLFIFIGF